MREGAWLRWVGEEEKAGSSLWSSSSWSIDNAEAQCTAEQSGREACERLAEKYNAHRHQRRETQTERKGKG